MSSPDETPQRPFDGPRHFLFVAANAPDEAADAVEGWADGPPDLCLTSPSRQALDTAVFACAGHDVPTIEEPTLAGRYPTESEDDFAARFAAALRTVNAFDTRAALVVCDDVPAGLETPRFVEGHDLLRDADVIERRLPLP